MTAKSGEDKTFLAVLHLEMLWAAVFFQVLAEIAVFLHLKIMNIPRTSTVCHHHLDIEAGEQEEDRRKETKE